MIRGMDLFVYRPASAFDPLVSLIYNISKPLAFTCRAICTIILVVPL